MNTALTTTRQDRQHQHPPSTTLENRASARRVGLIDHLALRLGVALVAWSRRPRVLDDRDDRDERARRVRATQATQRRERAMQRTAMLTLPPR